MPVVDVRKMRMLVRERCVAVPVLVRLVALPVEVVFVPMVLVMDMPVAVLHRFVHMLVLMVFGQV